MRRLLLDENLGRSVASHLRAAGLDVSTVREAGLRAASDDEVFAHARAGPGLAHPRPGLLQLHRFALGDHAGIVVGRFRSDIGPSVLAARLVEVLQRLTDDDLRGNLVMVSPSLLRIRRHELDRG